MNKIRNIGIVAHVDAGKTTLTEQMLYLSGNVRTLGKVDHESSNLDWSPIERERGITVFTELAQFSWRDYRFNIIDTPGHIDFATELDRGLAAIDGAILVISAVEGVQSHTEVVWELLNRRRIPTLIFVNKLDRMGADLVKVVQDIQARLSKDVLPLQTTLACEKDFSEIIDVLNEKVYLWTEDFSKIDVQELKDSERRQKLIEQIAEYDEEIFDAYIEDKPVTSEQLVGSIARLTRKRIVSPLLIGSSLRGIGVINLLEAVIDFLPSPTAHPEAPLQGLIYKIRYDQSVGKLCYVRLFNGNLTVREPVMVNKSNTEGFEEKVTQIRQYAGKKFQTVERLTAGDIGVLCGLSQGVAGAGIGEPYSLWQTSFTPVLRTTVTLEGEGSIQTLLDQLKILNQEEPTLALEWDAEQKQITIAILGLVQMEIIEELIWQRFGLKVKLTTPQVNYLETVTAVTRGFCHFEPKKHYAEVEVEIAPRERGQGIEFLSEVSTDDLPLQYQHAIENATAEALQRGPLAGRRVTDITVKLVAGKYHLEHTHGGDFRIATIRAIQQALERNNLQLLEPYYEFRIIVPKEHMGRVIADIQSLSGSIDEPELIGERALITGTVTVANFLNYPTELHQLTSGQGLISTKFSHYARCINEGEVLEVLKNQNAALDNSEDILYNSVSLFREKRKMKKVKE